MKALLRTQETNTKTPIKYLARYIRNRTPLILKKIKLRFFLLSILLLITTLLDAQQKVTYELVEIIDKTDGLSSNKVTSVYRHENLLILGTNNGVNQFDGYSFAVFNNKPKRKFTLTCNKIGNIVIDTTANIWVATRNGLNKINLAKSSHDYYFNEGNELYPPNEGGGEIGNLITQTSDGKLWGVNNGILYKIEGEEIEAFLADKYQHVQHLIADNQGNIYFFNKNNLIGLNSEGAILFDKNDSTAAGDKLWGLTPNLYKSKYGDIILTTTGYTKYFKVKSDGNLLPLSKEASNLVESIEMAKDYARKEQHSIFHVFDYLYDEQGIQWLGTNFGLMKFVPQYDYFSKIQPLGGVGCRGLYEHTNGLIFGGTYSRHDFFSYNPANQQVKWMEGIRNIYHIQQLQSDTLLLLSEGGPIFLFDAHKRQIIAQKSLPASNNKYYNSFIDTQDTIWVAENESIYLASVANPLNLTKLQFPPNDPIEKAKQFMQIGQFTNGDFLIATSRGLFTYQKGVGTIQTYSLAQEKAYQLSGNFVYQFVIDKKDNVWIATEDGLNYLTHKTGEITKAFSTEDGLCDNLIYSLLLENDSTLWLGTDGGLSQFNILKERFINYYKKDGLANTEFNSNAYLSAKDGQLYFGGIGGLTTFKSTNLPNKSNESLTFITIYNKNKIEDGKIRRYFYNPQTNQPIRVAADENYIEFELSNDNLLNPQKNRYAYYLEGYEKNWINLGNQNKLRYTNLDQGDYTLKVKSANEDGIWSNQILSVPITVQLPYYQQWWFTALVTFGMMSIFVLIYLGYQLQENKNNKIRYRIATDLHDDVSNSLNNIRMIAKELVVESPPKMEAGLHRIQRMSSSAIGHVNDVVWSIDRDLGSLQHLIFVMEDYLDDVVRSQNIVVDFQKVNLRVDNKLKILVRRNLLLIFKEAISNAVKHTQSSTINITLENKRSTFKMLIVNDFKDKKIVKHSTKKGLLNMQQRAKYINGKLDIQEQIDRFSVCLKLDFPI